MESDKEKKISNNRSLFIKKKKKQMFPLFKHKTARTFISRKFTQSIA